MINNKIYLSGLVNRDFENMVLVHLLICLPISKTQTCVKNIALKYKLELDKLT